MIQMSRRLAAVVVAFALAASATSIANDFTCDDRMIIADGLAVSR